MKLLVYRSPPHGDSSPPGQLVLKGDDGDDGILQIDYVIG